jgi:hypothetical protein
MTCQEKGSIGPDTVVDDTTIDGGKVAVAKMAFNGSSKPPVCRCVKMWRIMEGWEEHDGWLLNAALLEGCTMAAVWQW